MSHPNDGRSAKLRVMREHGKAQDETRAIMTPCERQTAIKAFGKPTRASKMPGACGPSLPPRVCPIGRKLQNVPTSPCFKCYAARLGKAYPSAGRRWESNLRTLHAALADAPRHYGNGISHAPTATGETIPAGQARCKTCEWIRAGVALLRDEAKHFADDRVRWQVAGDIQSAEHARMIFDVAALTPELSHRLPTMESPTLCALAKSGILPPANLKVSISLPRCDTYQLRPAPFGFATSNVWTREFFASHEPDGFVCPAVLEKHPCNACRACWPGVESKERVIYPQH